MNRHRPGYFKEYYKNHKEEIKVSQDKYRDKNPRIHIPDSLHGSRLRYHYKMSPEQYLEKLKEQDEHCALCTAVQGDDKRRMAVDHDHACCPSHKACGKCNRGILCADCNRKLGFLEHLMKDFRNPEVGEVDLRNSVSPDSWTYRALKYLKEYQ